MHPILARGSRLALYLAVWSFIGLLLAALLAGPGGLGPIQALAVALPLALVYAFVCLSAWYVSRSTPLAPHGLARLVTTALTASVISSAMWLMVARGWLEVFADGLFPAVRALLFGFGALLYLLALTASYLLAAFEQSRESERRGLEAQVLAREAELRSLRTQIDPHFLFNSLHSISALTTVNPAAARRMCVLLGDFLRDTVALGSEGRITLEREIQLAERFLEIERIRFGDRLHVEVARRSDGWLLVPPLLLQPLVENAVTHGVAQVLAGGTIRIAIEENDTLLTITIENPCDPGRPRRTGTGVGLTNVRARLRALYGDNASVTASETSGRWRVEIGLPAQRADAERSRAARPPDGEKTPV